MELISKETLDRIISNQSDMLESQYKQAAATERIENILGSNTMNNNKGLVAIVQEHELRLNKSESFIQIYENEKNAAEKRVNRNMVAIGLAFVVIQILISIKIH